MKSCLYSKKLILMNNDKGFVRSISGSSCLRAGSYFHHLIRGRWGLIFISFGPHKLSR